MKGMERRIEMLEAQLPSPKDEEAVKREEFLHNCTDESAFVEGLRVKYAF